MIDTKTIAWLAGIMEGEGSFSNMKGSPTIQVSMTDRDVIARIAQIVGVNPSKLGLRPRGQTVGGLPFKPVYRCAMHGTRAVQWMMTVYVLMGKRRQQAILGVIEKWKASSRMPRASRGQRFMATCHPERLRSGHGICHKCYMRNWRAKRKAALA